MKDLFRLAKEENQYLYKTKKLFDELHNYSEDVIDRKIKYFESASFRTEDKLPSIKIEQLIGYKNRVSELLETASMFLVKAQTV